MFVFPVLAVTTVHPVPIPVSLSILYPVADTLASQYNSKLVDVLSGITMSPVGAVGFVQFELTPPTPVPYALIAEILKVYSEIGVNPFTVYVVLTVPVFANSKTYPEPSSLSILYPVIAEL